MSDAQPHSAQPHSAQPHSTLSHSADQLLLPDIREHANLGTRLAKGAVGITLLSCVFLVVLAVVLLFSVRLDVSLEALGVLEPQTIHAIRSPVAGVVEEILVQSGETVHPGQVLLRLDVFALETHLAQLRLEADLKRNRPDTVRRDFQLLEQQIHISEQELARRTLRSPGPGAVLSENLEDLLGARATAGQLLMEVGSADAWQAELRLPEQDIHLVQEGDAVKFEIRAIATLEQWRHRLFEGKVTHVGSDVIVGQEGYYRVIAELDAASLDEGVRQRFRRGMSTEGRIITRSARAIDHLVRFFGDSFNG